LGIQQNEQVIDMKDILWEHIETTQLAQHNVGGNEFSVFIKTGILTDSWRFQEFLLNLVIVVVLPD
jgi:hypothetical protein